MISVGDLLIALGLFFLAAYMPRRILRPRPVRRAHAVVQTNDIRYTEGRTKNRYETRTKNRK
jgi:flagellar biogenesis protein FliO